MATQRTRPGRSLAFVLVVLIALYAALFFGKGGHARTPLLGIDLRGGTTVSVKAVPIEKGASVTKSELNETVNIIRNRIDGAGVGGAEINTQGNDNIVVTVPGQGRGVLNAVEQTALLSFRQVLSCGQIGSGGVCSGSTLAPSTTTPTTVAPSTGASTGAGNGSGSKGSSGKGSTGKGSSNGGSSKSKTGTSSSGDVVPAAFIEHKPKSSRSTPTGPSTTLTPSTAPSKSVKSKGSSTSTPSPSVSSSPGVTTSPSASTPPQPKAPGVRGVVSSSCPLEPGSTTVHTKCVLERGKFIVASPKLSDVESNFQGMLSGTATYTCAQMNGNPTAGDDISEDYMISCGTGQDAGDPYLLAPSVTTSSWATGGVLGSEVSSASSGFDSQGAEWQVILNFHSDGNSDWQKVTAAAAKETSPAASQGCATTGLGCNAVAIVLDGQVVSAPYISSPDGIAGQAQISGNFTQSSAASLANVLNYGSLPIKLQAGAEESISATLGSKQLRGGLIAGVISLILVALFSLVYYRALGLVTIASLALSGLILYAVTTELGYSRLGYTLSLAGIAGFIVAVGITADSFVVFFERLRDEVRDGKRLRSGVERAWPRARRTIISADAVSLLAAVILYIVSISDVRGFAFTLGLSTLSDLFIVFFFTKPLLTVISRVEAFDRGKPWTGVGRARAGRKQAVRRQVALATAAGVPSGDGTEAAYDDSTDEEG